MRGRTAIGVAISEVETPALVIDVDVMERNIAVMAAFARRHDIRIRPHAKMHKCATIARLQMQAGAVGVCVQKTSEAEALAAAGIGDIFISNEVVDPAKLTRIAELASRIRLGIAVDSVQGVERLAAAMMRGQAIIDVFVEVDVGQGRCGVSPRDAAALARRVVAHTPPTGGLCFAGIQAYQGRGQHVRGVEERAAASRDAASLALAAQRAILDAGIPCGLVTGSGTGSVPFDAATGVWGEWQAGSYLFMDVDYAKNALALDGPHFEHALFVKSQVMSRGASHAVIDAGLKSHSTDSGPPRVHRRALDVVSVDDDHATLRVKPGEPTDALPNLGDAIWLIPGHCDPTVNLHDYFVAVRGGLEIGVVEAVWPIEARGCIS